MAPPDQTGGARLRQQIAEAGLKQALQDLKPLEGGRQVLVAFSEAVALNASGKVAGNSITINAHSRGFSLSPVFP